MTRIAFLLLAVSLLLPRQSDGGTPTILNGDFEGAFIPQGNDLVPEHWTLNEAEPEPGEISILTSSSDNGPASPGASSVEWSRTNSPPSGDFTGIIQYFDPPIDVSQLTEPLMLSLDVQAIFHDLCASGWAPARSEFPVRVRVRFRDKQDVPKWWAHGWYVWTGAPCGPPPDGLVVVDSGGTEGIVYSEQIPAEVWVSRTYDLLEQLRTLAEPKSINSVQIGGAGWNFSGRADNVRFLDKPTSLAPNSWGAVKGLYR